MAEFLIGFAISSFFTLVGYLSRPKQPSRQSPNSGLTSLKADSPLPFVFGRQAVGGNIFAITDADVKGKKMTCWVSLGEGPIASIYDMKINDKPLSDISATRVSDSGANDKFMRFLFQYWNGGIDVNESQENLENINILYSDLDVTTLSKPGNEIHPGTAYFGINVRAGSEIGRVPNFSTFIEGLTLPKIPQKDGSILLYISDHNKYLTWAYDNTESDPFDDIKISKSSIFAFNVPNFRKRWVHYTANLLNFYDAGAGITYQSTPASSLELDIEDLCLTIQAAMNYYHATGSYNVSTENGNYVQTERIKITADLPFILTPRTGGHYYDSIFEDLGFRTNHDIGIWDLGVDFANTNNSTAPFHLEWPWFLGVNDKTHHEIPGMNISIIGWPLRTLSGRTEFLADFTYDRTFSDNPARVFYFMETVVFNKSVDVESFYNAEKDFNYLLSGFYDKVLLRSHELDIELPIGSWFGDAEINNAYMGGLKYIGSPSYIHDDHRATVIRGTPVGNELLIKNPVAFMFNESSNNYGIILIPATSIHDTYKEESYLIIDMNKERNISEISVEQEFQYNFLIQYSTNKVDWTDLHDRGVSGDYTFEEEDMVQTYSSKIPFTARYLKILNIKYSTLNEQHTSIEDDTFTDIKDRNVAAWVVRRIRIFEGYLARRYRCDLTVDSSLTRKEFHAFMSANYGMFKSSIDASDTTKIGLYKEEDSLELIDQDMFIKGTLKLHSIPASESFNSLLYSFFDINQDFASHPIVLNDDADQARQLRTISGDYESYVIQGPRQHLVGHCREQQAYRFAESKMKALKLASFILEIEATRNATLLEVGSVYEINYAEWSLDGSPDYILNGFYGRLIKRVRYSDERYLLLFEQHDNNVFYLTPREFTPIKSFTRPNPTLITAVTNLKIELLKNNSLFNPGNIYFRLTWDTPLHNNGFIGTEIYYKILNTEYDSLEDYTFLKRSDGKMFSLVVIPQNFIPNLIISFMLYSVASNGSISTSVVTKSIQLTEEMFKSDPIVNLHIANEKDILNHPDYYVEDDLYIAWSDVSNTGQNTGEFINREISGTANKLTSEFNLAFYNIYIQGKLHGEDSSWETVKIYRQYSTDFTYTSRQNQADFQAYIANSTPDGIIRINGPIKDIRVGVSKVNVFEIESDIVWMECTHIGDWRSINYLTTLNIFGGTYFAIYPSDAAINEVDKTLYILNKNNPDTVLDPFQLDVSIVTSSFQVSEIEVLDDYSGDSTQSTCTVTTDENLQIFYVKDDSGYRIRFAQISSGSLNHGGTGSEVDLITSGITQFTRLDSVSYKNKNSLLLIYHDSTNSDGMIVVNEYSISGVTLTLQSQNSIYNFLETDYCIYKAQFALSEDRYLHGVYLCSDYSNEYAKIKYFKFDLQNGLFVIEPIDLLDSIIDGSSFETTSTFSTVLWSVKMFYDTDLDIIYVSYFADLKTYILRFSVQDAEIFKVKEEKFGRLSDVSNIMLNVPQIMLLSDTLDRMYLFATSSSSNADKYLTMYIYNLDGNKL